MIASSKVVITSTVYTDKHSSAAMLSISTTSSQTSFPNRLDYFRFWITFDSTVSATLSHAVLRLTYDMRRDTIRWCVHSGVNGLSCLRLPESKRNYVIRVRENIQCFHFSFGLCNSRAFKLCLASSNEVFERRLALMPHGRCLLSDSCADYYLAMIRGERGLNQSFSYKLKRIRPANDIEGFSLGEITITLGE